LAAGCQTWVYQIPTHSDLRFALLASLSHYRLFSSIHYVIR
jgi:hypothetical protein